MVCEPEPGRVGVKRVLRVTGEIPSAAAVPKGCRFHPRCPYAEEACGHLPEPELEEAAASLGADRWQTFRRVVFPMLLPAATDQKKLLAAAERKLLERGRVEQGDVLVVTIGDTVGMMGHTNTMKIIKAGESR